jgi:hypothetical protein
VREHSHERPPLSVVERVPGIILAVREHRRRVAHLLAGLDEIHNAVRGSFVAELAERLRADDNRLEVLVAQLEENDVLLPVATPEGELGLVDESVAEGAERLLGASPRPARTA